DGSLTISNGTTITVINIEGDQDQDGIGDWWERLYETDLLSDASSDADLLTDLEEFIAGTNPLLADTDGDGLDDYEEVMVYFTNPLLQDSNSNGWNDFIEETTDPDSDGDDDGLTFAEELALGLDPFDSDSDDDGLTDGEEVLTYFTDPLNQDTDADLVNDYDEVVVHNSNPLSTDSDQDGLSDYLEVLHSLDPNDPTDASADFDMDGVPNDVEIFSNSDPRSDLSKPVLSGWTMIQGNSMHNGYHPIMVDPTNISVRWNVTDASLNTQPIAMDFGTIYAKHDSDILAAYNQFDGSLKWKVQVISDHNLSGPTVSDQSVLLHSGGHSNTFLRAFDKQTGEVIYKNSHSSQWPSYIAPTLYKDIVFMNGGHYGGMLAKDLETGETLWAVGSSIAGWENGWEPAVNEDAVYLVSSGSRLTALDRFTGEVSYQITSPASIGNQTLAVSSNGNVCAKGKSIVCFDTENQEVLWTSTADSSGYTNLAIGRGIVFAKKSSTGQLVAFNELNGEELWSKSLSSSIASNIAVTASHVFVGDSQKTYAINIQTQEIDWQYTGTGTLSLGLDGSLTISNGSAITVINIEGDQDQDGISDWWERFYETDLLSDESSDADLLTDLEEFIAGTNPLITDTDSDGLDDYEEVMLYFTNPNLSDTDFDLISDYDELNVYMTSPLLSDTDGDGINDKQEIDAGLDPLDNSDASLDYDNDHFENYLEIFANTDLNDNLDYPVLSNWTRNKLNNQSNAYQPMLINSDNISQRWSVTDSLQSIYAIISVNGNIINQSVESGRDSLVSRNAKDGLVNWRYRPLLNYEFKEISYDDGKIYTLANFNFDTYLLVIDSVTGEEIHASMIDGSYSSSYEAPFVSNGKIYARVSSSRLLALDAQNYSIQLSISTSGVSAGNILFAQDKIILKYSSYIKVLDASTFNEEYILGNLGAYTSIINEDKIFVSDSNKLMAFELISGIEISRVSQSINLTNAIYANSQIYNVIGKVLTAYNPLTGETVWSHTISSPSSITAKLIATFNYIFLTSSAHTTAVNINTQTEDFKITGGGHILLGSDESLIINTTSNITSINLGGDYDEDGINDWWENLYGLNAYDANDALLDLDEDGLTNAEEYALNTAPNMIDTDQDGLTDFDEINTYLTDPIDSDTDSDGIMDGWEVDNMLDPKSIQDAQNDDDLDGLTNLEEFLNETDPQDFNSKPEIIEFDQYSFETIGLQSPWLISARTTNISNDLSSFSDGASSLSIGGYGDLIFEGFFSGNKITFDIDKSSSCGSSSRYVNLTIDGELQSQKVILSGWNSYEYDIPRGLHEIQINIINSSATCYINLDYVRFSLLESLWDLNVSYALLNTNNAINLYDYENQLIKNISLSSVSTTSINSEIGFLSDGRLITIFGTRIYIYSFTDGSWSNVNLLELFDEIQIVSNKITISDTQVFVLVSQDTTSSYESILKFDISDFSGELFTTVGSYIDISFGNEKLYGLTGSVVDILDVDTLEIIESHFVVTSHKVSAGTENDFYVATNTGIKQYDEISGFVLSSRNTSYTNYDLDVNLFNKVILSNSNYNYVYIGEGLTGSDEAPSFTYYSAAFIPDYDGDQDGLPIWWENKFGLSDEIADDANSDEDMDSLSALQEFENKTDPTLIDSDFDGLNDNLEVLIYMTNPIKADTDSDGLNDYDEINSYSTSALLADSDNDGFSDGEEVLQYMTDPNDDMSLPAALASYSQSFETGMSFWTATDLSMADWGVDTSEAQDGLQSLKSGSISNSQKSQVQFTGMFTSGTFSFYYKSSTESCCDKLYVSVDGVSVLSGGVSSSWNQISFELVSGEHDIVFSYQKDGSVSSGSDAIWIDNIQFQSSVSQ
ncbi:MAG: PQQ-binding-like beta-propeller repeat protein, partial [Saccharospirillaceae bacterium]|nr:PQQ-binding-like beta-propeller repeat protein [Pseudomonadales bacterium]NRB80401.1 PQQ-binding-like beta-propeller repeat protein [Saccharospirillaceae bacterium]